ncbi:MAG: biotin/lipoyl-binding protein [Bacteroidetes bacterium]|nr:biotin/lipoyl-binding protein [Bacteroidota bacterium]MDA1119519.1 biotin/lipoyl-binding protein [Bacteroidota bacterium]
MYSVKTGSQKEIKVDVNGLEFLVNDKSIDASVERISASKYIVHYKNKSHTIEILGVNNEDKTVNLVINNKQINLFLRDKMDALLEKLGMNQQVSSAIKDLKAPMPGLILEICVSENQEVKKGDPLIVLEAMKMENVIKAHGEGVVKSILVKEKQSVEKNQVMIKF